MVKNKDKECLCLGTIGLMVAPWKFDVLKTSLFALEHQLSVGQLSADSSSTETLKIYCLIIDHITSIETTKEQDRRSLGFLASRILFVG